MGMSISIVSGQVTPVHFPQSFRREQTHLMVLKAYSCLYDQGSLLVEQGDHVACWGLHPDLLLARQMPSPWYYLLGSFPSSCEEAEHEKGFRLTHDWGPGYLTPFLQSPVFCMECLFFLRERTNLARCHAAINKKILIHQIALLTHT